MYLCECIWVVCVEKLGIEEESVILRGFGDVDEFSLHIQQSFGKLEEI